MTKQLWIQEKYQEDVINLLLQDFSRIQGMLVKSKYSTIMVENLISDLLDLAKIENDKFVRISIWCQSLDIAMLLT